MRFKGALTFILITICCYANMAKAADFHSFKNQAVYTLSNLHLLKDKADTPSHFAKILSAAIPSDLISFAQSLIGTPYRYSSTDPTKGLDCSGFINYVFNHFSIAVPRSSVDFTHVGQEIDPKDAKPGDLILFTGTNSAIRTVGHMGIILSSPGEELRFIHATSGKAFAVTESLFDSNYLRRYVKIIRVFLENKQ